MEAKVELSEGALTQIFDDVLELVSRGGQLVRDSIKTVDKKVEEKKNVVDLVTETDKAVEKLLFDGLRYVPPQKVYFFLTCCS